jgi:ABC-type transport system involved in multi-copper enzyme maturation permease subunit
MLKFLILILIFLLALSAFLVMSIGLAFGLVWIFPAISFEIGVLIGTVSLSMICYAFIGITNALSNMYTPPIEDDTFDKIYDEIDLDHIVLPRSRRSRRNRR